MTETAQPKRGGKAFHSILEPHFDFIHQQRQRRKTWQEIADLLFTEKGIRVTLYAPYHFYRRRLKQAAHWENSSVDLQPAHPSAVDELEPAHFTSAVINPVFNDHNRIGWRQCA